MTDSRIGMPDLYNVCLSYYHGAPEFNLSSQNHDYTNVMGSKQSKHSRSFKDPYRALADQTASRINAQHLRGLDDPQIAAAVPNGKDPLIVMFRKNEEGQYAYNQEYYSKFGQHRPRQPSGHQARQRDVERVNMEREGRDRGRGEQKGEEKVSVGRQGGQGSERVHTPASRGEEQRSSQAVHEPPRARTKRSGDGKKKHRGEGKKQRGEEKKPRKREERRPKERKERKPKERKEMKREEREEEPTEGKKKKKNKSVEAYTQKNARVRRKH